MKKLTGIIILTFLCMASLLSLNNYYVNSRIDNESSSNNNLSSGYNKDTDDGLQNDEAYEDEDLQRGDLSKDNGLQKGEISEDDIVNKTKKNIGGTDYDLVELKDGSVIIVPSGDFNLDTVNESIRNNEDNKNIVD